MKHRLQARLKKFLMVVAALAVAIPATVAVGGTGRDRVTGGGQILIGANAGSTIAFTAQQLESGSSTDARGEVQYVNRGAAGENKGLQQVVEHGDVFCVTAEAGPNPGDPGMAEIAYVPKGTSPDDEDADIDQLYIVDSGEPNQGADIVFVDEDPESTCDLTEDDEDDGQVSLGRGNAQVYDGG